MERDVRQYFSGLAGEKTRLAHYTGSQLARGGVTDMDTLCALLADTPEHILNIRNIGAKSMVVIQSACERYLDRKAKIRTKCRRIKK